VFCTANFARTVVQQSEPAALNEYLRPPGSLLLFPATREVLLVSEREADALAAAAWSSGGNDNSTGTNNTMLLNVTYTQQTDGALPLLGLVLSNPRSSGDSMQPGAASVQPPELASVWLWGGDTRYGGPTTPLFSSLVQLLRQGGRSAAKEGAEALVGMRGKQALFARSQLEQACEMAAAPS
jgi:hypothetical protein